MIIAQNITLSFGQQTLFKDVSLIFTPENCYGLIGGNGSGKSTFLIILSGEIEPSAGEVILGPNQRLAMLRQDHFAFDDFQVLETVIMGHRSLKWPLRKWTAGRRSRRQR